MEQVGTDAYKRDDYLPQEILFEYYLDLRYAGQEHSVKLKLEQTENIDIEQTKKSFHELHEKRFAFQLSDTGIEIVNFHLVAEVEVNKPLIAKVPITGKMLKKLFNGGYGRLR